MVKSSVEDGSSMPPFLLKCYEMVDDQATDAIISWSQSNDSFVIWDMAQFSLQLLPKYFKHKNFSSFMRQLNIYGFRKIDTDFWEFANDGFIRGQKQLMKNIIRRKKPQGLDKHKSSQQKENSDQACQEIENCWLWKEVENLKTDKNSLMQELVKLRQHQETADNKLVVLRERLQGMETDQQQMLSFLIMAMQTPGFLVQLLHPKENNWRTAEPGNTMLEEVIEEGETLASDGMIVKYQPSTDETPKPLLPPLLSPSPHSERSTEFDLSDGMKDFLMNADFMKMMIDENFCSSENQNSIVIPDLPDDTVLDQLFLSYPLFENTEDANLDSKEPDDPMETEPTVGGSQFGKSLHFEPQTDRVDPNLKTESTTGGAQMESPQNMDFLTENQNMDV